MQLWLMVSAADGWYNGGRAEANVWLASRPDFTQPDWLDRVLDQAGFVAVRDRAGTSRRARRPVDDIREEVPEHRQGPELTGWAVRRLEQAGFRTAGA